MDSATLIIAVLIGLTIGFGIAKFMEKGKASKTIGNAKQQADAILKSASYRPAIEDVDCHGITNITPAEIEKARSENARWKLIGAVEKKEGRVSAWVHPEMVPLAHPLAGPFCHPSGLP